MKKSILVLLTLLLITAVVFTGCSKKEEKDSGVKKIGYCSNNFNDTFQTYINKAASDYVAANPDLSMTQVDAQEDVIKQQDLINTFIAQGVDALVVVPVDTSAMAPITKAAQEAKIPICYINRNPYAATSMPEGVYYVGSQEIVAGQLQMDFIGEKIGGKGNVAILMGKLDNEGAIKRTEGNEDVIAKKYPDIKVLAKETGNWQRDQGMSITENWLTAYGDKLSAILANNDEMALGAVEALKAAGKKIPVVGVDAIPDAKTAVKNGSLDATVLQDAVGQGKGGLELIHSVLKGATPEQLKWVPFVLITPENIKDFE
ncbi:MAG: sugar ABC transporter substrate-binding protein [Spirochaetia bacterium]|jgi:inositol transport system substrate-binding protein|nr:sugar ABC transporter substrate-binding protein [Spirochaetia bacterium]